MEHLATLRLRHFFESSASWGPELRCRSLLLGSSETEGYSNDDSLPEYRGPILTGAMGHFSGPFGSEISNLQIPPGHFPERLQTDKLFEVEVRQSVAEIENLVASAGEQLQVPWPPNFISMTNTLIQRGEMSLIEGHGIVKAWRPVQKATLVGILDRVRTKVLDLALELEQRFPDAGTPNEVPDQGLRDALGLTVSAVVYGSNNVINLAGRDAIQTGAEIPALDRAALVQHLSTLGVPAEDIAELETAIEADGDQQRDSPGPAVSRWISRANAAGSAIAANAAGSAVVTAVFSYLGIA